MATDLEIRLLGGLTICLRGVPLVGFVSSKVPALLAYLVATRRSHQRDALATLLWGEMGDAAAANNLRQALSNLRKYLDPYLVITRDSVQLDPGQPIDLDIAEFERVITAARSAGVSARNVLLQQACDLYQGDFLAGVIVRDAPEFDEWLLAQRMRLREQAIHALHTLADLHLAQAHHDQAIECATRLLALDAWREKAHRQMMSALAHSGRRGAALAQYERCRQILAEELGVEPAAETAALAARIRASGDAPAHNLPPQPTALVGRNDEIAEIGTQLLQPDCRLLTLVGAGGMGKTRLALHAAVLAYQQGLFLDGVYFAELTTVTTGSELSAAVANALGTRLSGSKPVVTQLLEVLRTKELLLVLDNFEHLLEESNWLVQLLQQAPLVKLLVTSREALSIRWEWSLPIEGLPVPPRADVEEAERYASVMLFRARARAVRSNFDLDRTTIGDVVAICRLVEGMPLGIELAAAQLRHYSCGEIAAAIGRNLDFLAVAYRDMSPRHRSLRAVFDYSWDRLPPAVQRVFAALSVFSGTFGLHAAEEIAWATRPILNTLVEKSLLRRSGDDRFTLHELLRQYVQGRLTDADALRARIAHTRLYCHYLGDQGARIKSAAQKDAMARIALELDNLHAAWNTAIEDRDWDHVFAAMDGLYHFYMVRSRFLEGADLFGRARQALSGDGASSDHNALQRRLYAHVTTRYARFLVMLSRHAEAQTLLAESLATLRALGDIAGVAAALMYLGAAATSLGQYDLAQRYLSECLELRRGLDDGWGQAVCLLELAGLAFYQGDFQRAQAVCAEGLRLALQAGDPEIIAHLLTGSSIVARQLGDFMQAQDFVARSLALYEELDDPYGVIQGELTLGGLALSRRLYADAAGHYERGLALSCTIGFRSGEVESHCRLGQIATAMHEEARAVAHLQTALYHVIEIQEAPLLLDTVFAVATLCGEDDRTGSAHPLWNWLLARPELDAGRRAEVLAHLGTPIRTAGYVASDADPTVVVTLALRLLTELGRRSAGAQPV